MGQPEVIRNFVTGTGAGCNSMKCRSVDWVVGVHLSGLVEPLITQVKSKHRTATGYGQKPECWTW